MRKRKWVIQWLAIAVMATMATVGAFAMANTEANANITLTNSALVTGHASVSMDVNLATLNGNPANLGVIDVVAGNSQNNLVQNSAANANDVAAIVNSNVQNTAAITHAGQTVQTQQNVTAYSRMMRRSVATAQDKAPLTGTTNTSRF